MPKLIRGEIMRTAVTIDDDLVNRAMEITGIYEKSNPAA
jgi:Arc/MetJ family transcription regulator